MRKPHYTPHSPHSWHTDICCDIDAAQPIIQRTARYFQEDEWNRLAIPVRIDVLWMAFQQETAMARTATKEKLVTKDKIINPPSPVMPHEDWLGAMSIHPGSINMRQYRDMSGVDKRTHMIEGARRVTAGLKAKLLKVELVNLDDERVNHYCMTDEAKQFWQNGREQDMTNQQIMEGWEALQSMIDDTKSDS